MLEEIEDTALYRVARNAQGEYFLWPAYRTIPPGWTDEGTTGSKQECLAYIEHKREGLRAANTQTPQALASTRENLSHKGRRKLSCKNGAQFCLPAFTLVVKSEATLSSR